MVRQHLKLNAEAERDVYPVKTMMLLRDRNFLLLISGQTLATFGNNIYTLAILWMMEEETRHQPHSTLMLGLVMMSALLPRILLAPIAGVLVDRWPKRFAMLVTDFSRGGLLLVLTALTFLHHTAPWELLTFNFVLSAIGTAFNPAAVVLTKGLASDERLMDARSLQNIGQKSMEIAGPAAGGLLIGSFGIGTAFAINTATFFISAITLAVLRAPEPTRRRGSLRPTALYGDVREGVSVYLQTPYARALTPFLLLYNFPMVATEFLVVNFVARTLHFGGNHGAFIVGMLNTALALGELAGSFAIPYFSRVWSKERLPVICMSIAAVCVFIVGMLRQPLPIAALFFLAGFFVIIGNTVFFTGVQLAVPIDALGRIYALISAMFDTATPLSQVAFGVAATFVPVSALFSTAGGLAFLGISAAWLSPVVRRPARSDLPTEVPQTDPAV